MFGEAADLYDLRRPGYPDAAIDAVVAAVPGARDVLDVGAGTGKASVAFAARGLRVTAVEPDPAMAAVARRAVPAAEVVVARFEDWSGEDCADIVASAQAWHWMDPDAAIPKAAAALRPGGALAVIANAPRDGGVDLADEIDAAYRQVAPGLAETSVLRRWPVVSDEQRERLRASGLFRVEDEQHFDWDEPLSGAAYAELLQTHSDHRMLPPGDLAVLAEAVRGAIDAAGGTVVARYRTLVTIALVL